MKVHTSIKGRFLVFSVLFFTVIVIAGTVAFFEQIGAVSNETVGAMDTIFTEIHSMDASFAVVSNAVEEQTAGGSQILSALKTIQGKCGTEPG
ncbi:hypothetical protein FACS1894172_11940 [Spirochaetia bacterium]|nr:hypothetical protein FACS1894172_11940 [Spirochaetia bacterium]